jgi:UDP-N-acetylglucosamine 2-epimerase (non-hydrolysing)/GDP/UDP-N,N'-diacetylbacillosamine 2-epimerase (hydrolysing)
LITFHPETLEPATVGHCGEMLSALQSLGPDVGLLFTGSNADTAGREIDSIIRTFVEGRANAVVHRSLGSLAYFSALRWVDMVVGNSSSGLYEAPSFRIPTVNIGDRQRGRPKAASVIDCRPERGAILRAIEAGFQLDCSNVVNPYGDGHAAERIVKVLQSLDFSNFPLKKRFFEGGLA